jgi:hypothetical protein
VERSPGRKLRRKQPQEESENEATAESQPDEANFGNSFQEEDEYHNGAIQIPDFPILDKNWSTRDIVSRPFYTVLKYQILVEVKKINKN